MRIKHSWVWFLSSLLKCHPSFKQTFDKDLSELLFFLCDVDQSRIDTCIDPLIICYVCGPHTHIIRDYKSSNSRVNARLTLLLYMCVAHTHEPNPCPLITALRRELMLQTTFGILILLCQILSYTAVESVGFFINVILQFFLPPATRIGFSLLCQHLEGQTLISIDLCLLQLHSTCALRGIRSGWSFPSCFANFNH